jgi:GNAT superfamily N-acetyltransferase
LLTSAGQQPRDPLGFRHRQNAGMTACVRQARSHDWPELWPLLVGMGARDGEESSRERFVRLTSNPFWLIVVASDEGRLIGYAAAQDYGDHLRGGKEGRVARLHDVYVSPGRRSAGVGRQLMEAVVGWASSRVRFLHWQAHERRSAPFYERLGYRGEPCPQPDYPEFEIKF